jgi:GH35 family endo-1,4-beta-xylanase
MNDNPTYTLQPKMQDGRLAVYVVELDITVETDTADIEQALHQASDAIVDYLDKQEGAAQVSL